MPTLSEIAAQIPSATAIGSPVKISGITHDSRDVQPGDLFAVLSGATTDGSLYIEEAKKRGAAALLVDKPVQNYPQILVPNTRKALGAASCACYENPTSKLKMVGITGTNGKTTTTYLVEAALESMEICAGVMGTVEYRVGSKSWEAKHTTPEAPVVHKVAKKILDEGASHLIMETSSHGLALGRLGGVDFDVVAFTNLTQDHLDFHKDMQSYAAAKMLLFTQMIAHNKDANVVVNIDDPFSKQILEKVTHKITSVSINPNGNADIRPLEKPVFSIDGIRTKLVTPQGQVDLRSPMLGPHNLSNLVLALGICAGLGHDLQAAAKGLGDFSAVPGRLERIESSGGPAVLVDYAHTPDALQRALAALRPLTRGRLICVFGCGGDRDPGKRPLMGRAVKEGADIGLVTSDNPRTEDPQKIIDMIIPGISDEGDFASAVVMKNLGWCDRGFLVEIDRSKAIESAIESANPQDTVLIAGKGHEDYQILGTEKIHFDDREQAREALKKIEVENV